MRGSSRHGPSRPDRARRPAADGAGPRHEGRPGRRQPDTRAAGSQPAGAAAPDRPQAARPAEPERLTSLLEPVVRSAGLDLESVRISAAGRRWLLRVVVDADNGPGLDEIALVSRSVSAELDASGVMGQAAYTLEVSSPGVDRPLTEPRHWRRAVGRLVYAPLSRPASDRRAGQSRGGGSGRGDARNRWRAARVRLSGPGTRPGTGGIQQGGGRGGGFRGTRGRGGAGWTLT